MYYNIYNIYYDAWWNIIKQKKSYLGHFLLLLIDDEK